MTADVALDRHGTPGGTLVILLHGAVANRKMWLPVARAMPPGYELVCPDLPGHGARRDEPFRMARALDDVAAHCALARPRRIVLAGDSLGGYIALAAAARAPHGLVAVVAGGCSWSMTGFGGILARASDVPVRAIVRALGLRRATQIAQTLVPRVTDAASARAIVEAGLRLEARGESLRELAGIDVVRLVREVRVPVTIVSGRYDWPTRAGESSLVRASRDARVAISPRSGHGVGMFDPAFFARAIDAAAGRAALTHGS